MIPNVIHYCWFGGGDKPALVKNCIQSWKRYLPEYEIKEWNEDNFDVSCISYVEEAYKHKKYAFVSDYARFKILYEYGGVYFDTDVEVIKSMDRIIANGSFMGLERNPKIFLNNGVYTNNMEYKGENVPGLGLTVNAGLGLAAEAGHRIYKEILDKYEELHFINVDGSYCLTTVVQYVTDILLSKGIRASANILECDGIKIYPTDFFNPKQMNGKVVITKNTHTIHHFAASWYSTKQRVIAWMIKHIGLWPARVIALCWRNPFSIVSRCVKYVREGI